MAQVTSIRNAKKDHLLTPENCLFAFIDYQPEQFRGVGSKSSSELLLNAITLGKIARAFDVPTVVTTVGVQMGVNQGTQKDLIDALPPQIEIDRTTLNSWEDENFLSAIVASGRKKIVMAGLWTEVCVAYPTLDAIKDGYEVYPVIDAIGGVTKDSHEAAVQRMIQAGAIPVTALAIACELQRDWARSQGHALRTIMQDYFRQSRFLKEKARENRQFDFDRNDINRPSQVTL
ncbi:hydrolase [Bdellovibrio sp. qaytius]|nr:hydrolase [Bdellovibrio sp. qaytius]